MAFNFKNLRFFWQVIFVLFYIAPVAQAAPTFPPLSGRVVDQANLLDPQQEQLLVDLLKNHEEKTTNQVVVVTLASLQGYSIDDYGYQLGRAWGIGQKAKNNGALLIVAPNDRKVRIEVGYGLEGLLTDAASNAIIQQNILPLFKQGQYAQGIREGVARILATLEGTVVHEEGSSADNDSINESASNSFGALLIAWLVVILFYGASIFVFGSIFIRIPYIGPFMVFIAMFAMFMVIAGFIFALIIAVVGTLLLKVFSSKFPNILPINSSGVSRRGSSWGGSSSSSSRSSSYRGGGGSFGGGGSSGSW